MTKLRKRGNFYNFSFLFYSGGGEEKQWKKLTKDPYGMARTVAR
jgi:hypothetical protein